MSKRRKCVSPDVALHEHYRAVASLYDGENFFFNTPKFANFVIRALLDEEWYAPSAETEPIIADVGGGTGHFTEALARAANVLVPALCVDNSAAMLAQAAAHDNVRPFLMDAVNFSKSEKVRCCDRVLLKEMIHHLSSVDRHEMFAGFADKLPLGGRFTVITRPQYPCYPFFFRRALEIWARQQPCHLDLLHEIRCAAPNFKVTATRRYLDFGKVPVQIFLEMIRGKCWSEFSFCTDDELARGIQEIQNKFAGQASLDFTEELIFITACRF